MISDVETDKVRKCEMWTCCYSQNGWSQSLFLVQPFCLPQFEDLAVVESVDFVLKELQGGGLAGQRPGDLLSHHLHHLEMDTLTVSTYSICIWAEHCDARQVTCSQVKFLISFFHFQHNKQGIFKIKTLWQKINNWHCWHGALTGTNMTI